MNNDAQAAWNNDAQAAWAAALWKAKREREQVPMHLRCGCTSSEGRRWCSERATQEDLLCDHCRTDEGCALHRKVWARIQEVERDQAGGAADRG